MNAYDAVDEFLVAQHGTHLEEVLCDGCFVGRLDRALTDVAKVLPRLVRSTLEEDGGLVQLYEGILDLDGLWYSFRCQIFIDQSGQRFLSDVAAFDAVEWQARVKVPA
jgi:hypothetical protein